MKQMDYLDKKHFEKVLVALGVDKDKDIRNLSEVGINGAIRNGYFMDNDRMDMIIVSIVSSVQFMRTRHNLK